MEDLTELKENIEKNYKLKVKSIEKNQESTDGNVYILNCKKEKYIVKIYTDLMHTNSMWDIHRYLTALEQYVPYVVKTKAKTNYMKLNESYVIIYSFLPGKSLKELIKEDMLDDERIALVAKAVRRFHYLTNEKKFNLPNGPFVNKFRRKSVLHFDLTKDNILIDGDKVGFIDFDDAKFGDSACDVAIAILFLFVSKDKGVDNHAIKVFLDNYYGDNEVLYKKETPLLKEYADEWIKYVVRQGNLDSSTVEKFKAKRKQIKYIEI